MYGRVPVRMKGSGCGVCRLVSLDTRVTWCPDDVHARKLRIGEGSRRLGAYFTLCKVPARPLRVCDDNDEVLFGTSGRQSNLGFCMLCEGRVDRRRPDHIATRINQGGGVASW